MLCLVKIQVMILKLLIFAFCFLALMEAIAAYRSLGRIGNIEVYSIYECDESKTPLGDEINATIHLVDFDDDGGTAADVVLENKIPIDDNLNLLINFKIHQNGGYKYFTDIQGKFCEETILFPKLWSKIVAAFEPKLKKSCPIPPGSYKLNKLQISKDDIDLKNFGYGKFLVTATLTDQSGKLVFCQKGEGICQGI